MEQTYQKGVLTVDFFRHIEDNNESFSYAFYRKDGYIYNSQYEYHARAAITKKIPGVTTMTTSGVQFHIPSNAEEHLAIIYGAGWRIPDPNWQPGDGAKLRYFGDEIAILEYMH